MPARRPTRIQGVRERRLTALAAISAMPSQRRVRGIRGGNAVFSDNKESAIASVATATAAARVLFFIRAERYAGWERVSMAGHRRSVKEHSHDWLCHLALGHAFFRPLGTRGRLFRRWAVALKMAFPIAGATAIIGVSPAPAGAMSLRSSRTASMSGMSRKRGTRYLEKRGLVIRPFSNSMASKSAPPRP